MLIWFHAFGISGLFLGIATFSEVFSIFGDWRLHFNVTGGFQKHRIGGVVMFRVGGGVFVGISDIIGMGCWGPFVRVGSVFYVIGLVEFSVLVDSVLQRCVDQTYGIA